MRRVIAALATLTLAVVGAITMSAGSSSASTEMTVGELPPGGTLTLKTKWSGTSTGSVVFADGDDGGSQTLTQGCTPLSSPGILSLGTGTCFGTAGLGVGSGGGRWHLNPDVSGTEKLVLSLAPDSGRLFASFSLDIEAVGLQAGTDLKVVPSLNGVDLDPLLYDLNPLKVLGVALPNYRVKGSLPQVADTLTLQATGTTKFQLEGDTAPTTFDLVEVTDVVPCEGGALPAAGAELTVTPGDSCTGGEAVVFTRSGNQIDVLKEPSDATFLLEITSWESETAAYPVPPTQIDYTPLNGVDDSDDMVVCTGTTAEPSLPGDLIPGGGVDGWCVAGQSFELVGGGEMKVTETLYGEGDPRFNRI